MKIYWIIGIAIFVLVILFYLISVNRKSYRVRFILPENYRGLFKIKVDYTYDLEITKQNGEYIFQIPSNGILILRDDFPLYKWHEIQAYYQSGKRIEIEQQNLTDSTPCFFTLVTTDKKETYFLVGTKAEYDQFWNLNNQEREKYIGKKIIP